MNHVNESQPSTVGAGPGGEGGFTEAVAGVEHDRDGAAKGVDAVGVTGAVVIEVDLLEEGCSGVGELHGSVAAEEVRGLAHAVDRL